MCFKLRVDVDSYWTLAFYRCVGVDERVFVAGNQIGATKHG